MVTPVAVNLKIAPSSGARCNRWLYFSGPEAPRVPGTNLLGISITDIIPTPTILFQVVAWPVQGVRGVEFRFRLFRLNFLFATMVASTERPHGPGCQR